MGSELGKEREGLYTTTEVAQELGITPRRVRQLVEQGIAKPVEVFGKTWVFTKAEIERLHQRPKRAGRKKKQ